MSADAVIYDEAAGWIIRSELSTLPKTRTFQWPIVIARAPSPKTTGAQCRTAGLEGW